MYLLIIYKKPKQKKTKKKKKKKKHKKKSILFASNFKFNNLPIKKYIIIVTIYFIKNFISFN